MDLNNIPPIKLDMKPDFLNQPAIPHDVQKALDEHWQHKKLLEREEQEYRENSLKYLKAIEENTANLATLDELISNGNDKQDEIIEILKELFELAKHTDKSKAESAFRNVMNRIHSFEGDVSTIVKLMGFASTLWGILQSTGVF